jgi:hypothetical protein
MVMQTENRESKRHKHDAALLYAFHNSEKYYSATMCDYGDDGMCFVAGYSLEPGSEIFIRMENFPCRIAMRFFIKSESNFLNRVLGFDNVNSKSYLIF